LSALLFPLPPGLIAITGDEGAGKTTLLRRLAGDLPPLPGQPADLDALWLDLALPGQDQATPGEVWTALRARCPRWNADLHGDLVEAMEFAEHAGKKLFMLSTGSRRKVAILGLLAAGAAVTCLDQPFGALDKPSARVIREFLGDMAGHASRSWLVADYEADPGLPWVRQVALPVG
jgi:ABC-type multidrug transport system ATPase subunit